MRQKLKKLKKRYYCFTATFGVISVKHIVLTNLKLYGDSKIITDPVWISKNKKICRHGLRPGDRIKFSATVRLYFKGDYAEKADYSLSNIINIKVLNRNPNRKPRPKKKPLFLPALPVLELPPLPVLAELLEQPSETVEEAVEAAHELQAEETAEAEEKLSLDEFMDELADALADVAEEKESGWY